MLTHIPFPALPVPPSWFPGHMLQFQRMLPTLLNKTDVVLELRDARLPLTSINRNFEGAFRLPRPAWMLPCRSSLQLQSGACLRLRCGGENMTRLGKIGSGLQWYRGPYVSGAVARDT